MMANTGNHDSLELNEESASTRQGTRFKSPIPQEFQELESEEITPVELTCYGSAPEEHWTELAKDSQDEGFVMEEESFSEDVQLMDLRLSESFSDVRLMDLRLSESFSDVRLMDLRLLEEIAEGG